MLNWWRWMWRVQKSEVSKWVNTNFEWESFLWWSEKTGRRRMDFLQKRKRRQQPRFSKKRGCWKERRVCKRRKKAGKVQPNQRETSKKKERYIQKWQQKKKHGKNRCSRKRSKKENVTKKQDNTHKKGEVGKKDREKDEHAKTYKFVKMSNKKVKSFWKCRSVKYALQKEVIDREQEEKKDNRWTNRWTKRGGGHKEATHACKKWNVEEFLMQKERGLVVQKKNQRKWRKRKMSSRRRRSWK